MTKISNELGSNTGDGGTSANDKGIVQPKSNKKLYTTIGIIVLAIVVVAVLVIVL